MKTFEVHSHPSGKLKAVKYGFSWPAFFFAPLWALIKRLWLCACALLLLAGLFAITDEVFSGSRPTWYRFTEISLTWLAAFGLGLWGNRLVAKKLVRKGYDKVATVNAWTRSGAITVVENNLQKGTVEVIPRFGFTSPILACALVLSAMLLNLTLVAYYIASPGMLNTLRVNDRVFFDRFAYAFNPPRRGDIVVFRVPEVIPNYDPEKPIWVKRIVGLEGETVSIENDQLRIDGEEVSDPPFFQKNSYYPRSLKGNDYNPHVVPEGHVLVFGDNSKNSYDGRYWGTLKKEGLIGKAIFRFWPPSRFGRIYDAPISKNPYSIPPTPLPKLQ